MAFEQLKQRHAAVWSSAPFEKVAGTIADVHDHLVDRLGVTPGERWLDVACGTGAVALRAARRGARVTGIDIAPRLVETARRLAAEAGADIAFDVGDAEALPYADASFDTAVSTFGVMFAPDHAAVARELARVVRPGGRLGLVAWDPQHGVPDLFKLMRGFQPPPPEGAGNPFAWGDPEHVRSLLGGDFELAFDTRVSPQTGDSGEAIWDLMVEGYGPTRALAESLDPERRAALRQVWIDFYGDYRQPDGSISHPRPYLVATGTRR